LTFDASPALIVAGLTAWLVVASLALAAWHRSGWSRRVGLLEGGRTAIAALVVLTLFQPEWTQTYQPTDLPVLAVLVDKSRSMDTRDVVDPNEPHDEARTRAEWVAAELQQIDWDRLVPSVRVVREEFAS